MKGILALVFCLALMGCTPSIPKGAFNLSPTSLEDRQLQTRRFDTLDRREILSAAAAVLQDIGYTLDESNSKLGVLTASKKADAKSGGQIAGAILVAALTGVATPIDKEQHIRMCLVVNDSLNEEGASLVRVTLQRVIWNDQGLISRVESIKEPEIYQDFFEKLSKSVFLEAHKI